jgi:Bacterial Ig-like domain (group 3)
MKTRFASVAAGVATLATTGALLLVGAGVANAATPPFQVSPNTDPNEVGTLTLYNAAGSPITSGSLTDAPLAAYYVGSTADSTHTKATQFFYTPKNGVAQSAWSGEQASLSTTYPNTTAPAPINAAGSDPVVTGDPGDESLATYISDIPNTDTSTTDGYAGLYEIRVKTDTSGQYQAADIQVSGTTWTQVFPAAAIGTSTTLTSSGSPANTGDNVTLTATVADSDSTTPAGAVTFVDTSASPAATLCTAVAVTAGKATCSTTTLAVGTHAITATYTPTSSSYGTSSGSLSQVITTPHTSTTTSLTISGNTTTGTDATLSGTVAPSAATGTVAFFDNGSTTPLVTTPATVDVASGAYTATLTGGFADGSHSVVAVFTPDTTSAATYNGSSSAPQAFTTVKAGGTCVQTGSTCTDTQTITGTVPAGTLVISTPYTATNPLNVGTLALNTGGTAFTGSAAFQCITITDSNGVNTGFVAQAAATTLSQTSGPAAPPGTFSSIDGQNVGLTGLAPSTAACPNGSTPVNTYSGAPGSITATDNPAAPGVTPGATSTVQGLGASVAHTILTGSANGVGTATYDGTLTLNAPTNTAPGVYTGQIVFTVSDGE